MQRRCENIQQKKTPKAEKGFLKKTQKDLKFECAIQYIQISIWPRMKVLIKVTDHKGCLITGYHEAMQTQG